MNEGVIYDILVEAGCEGVTAYRMRLAYQHMTKIAVDWHRFSSWLDQAYTRGVVRVIGFSAESMTIYALAHYSDAEVGS